MFLHVSVFLSMGRGGYNVTSCLVPCSFSGAMVLEGEGVWYRMGIWSQGVFYTLAPVMTSSVGHPSRQYASYWYAFLFNTATLFILDSNRWMKLLGCHADHQKFSRCCTRGESGGIHHSFEIYGRHHQKSKTGV